LPLEKALLSSRLARSSAGQPSLSLSETQLQRLAEFRARLDRGDYRLINQSCICGLDVADDVCIAQIDRYGLPLTSVLCLACGTVRIDPYLDEPSLSHFYAHLYQELYGRNRNLSGLFAYQGQNYGERIANYYDSGLPPRATVLEVGCGTGGAIAAFDKRGHRIAGCDLSDDLVRYGTSRGVANLWSGTIREAPAFLAQQRFDLIYLFHVLEHVRSPLALLEELRERLAPQGRILVVVPDLGRIDSHRNPAGNVLTFLHVAHTFNFTMAGLQNAAARVGLAASLITPPWRDEQALPNARHLPELWIELSAAPTAANSSSTLGSTGREMLAYLRQTERLYLSGQCPAQRAIAAHSQASRPAKWYERWRLARVARRWLGLPRAA
jgi:SAM-dependent methyltransferase